MAEKKTMDDLIFSNKQLQNDLSEKEQEKENIRNKIHILEDSQGQLEILHRKKQDLYDDEFYLTKGTYSQRSVYNEIQEVDADYEEGMQLFHRMFDSLEEDYQQLDKDIENVEEKIQKNKLEMLECQK